MGMPQSREFFLPGSSSMMQTMLFWLCWLRLSSRTTIEPAAPAPMSMVGRMGVLCLRMKRRSMR